MLTLACKILGNYSNSIVGEGLVNPSYYTTSTIGVLLLLLGALVYSYTILNSSLLAYQYNQAPYSIVTRLILLRTLLGQQEKNSPYRGSSRLCSLLALCTSLLKYYRLLGKLQPRISIQAIIGIERLNSFQRVVRCCTRTRNLTYNSFLFSK